MLKEMTLLMIVLWGSQGKPTTPFQQSCFRMLSDLYCKAEDLLKEYQAVDKKFMPPEARPDMASAFSQPGCNFTEQAEECQILRAFNALFPWLQSTYPQERLLEPVTKTFKGVIKMQKSYINCACPHGASEKGLQITCPTYNSDKPKLENKLHYIFELYRNHTHDIWRSKVTEKKKNVNVCNGNN